MTALASAVSHQDNLEFLEDIVPKTVPFKKIKASALATQAKLRGDKMTSEDGLQSTLDASTTNGTAAPAATNGDGSTFSVPLRMDDRDDPNDQLELEMRQAAQPHDGDVEMRG